MPACTSIFMANRRREKKTSIKIQILRPTFLGIDLLSALKRLVDFIFKTCHRHENSYKVRRLWFYYNSMFMFVCVSVYCVYSDYMVWKIRRQVNVGIIINAVMLSHLMADSWCDYVLDFKENPFSINTYLIQQLDWAKQRWIINTNQCHYNKFSETIMLVNHLHTHIHNGEC